MPKSWPFLAFMAFTFELNSQAGCRESLRGFSPSLVIIAPLVQEKNLFCNEMFGSMGASFYGIYFTVLYTVKSA